MRIRRISSTSLGLEKTKVPGSFFLIKPLRVIGLIVFFYKNVEITLNNKDPNESKKMFEAYYHIEGCFTI